jgi:hypothetical protein
LRGRKLSREALLELKEGPLLIKVTGLKIISWRKQKMSNLDHLLNLLAQPVTALQPNRKKVWG